MTAPRVQNGSLSVGVEELCALIARWAGPERVPRRLRIHTDTTDFFRVDYDDVLVLGGKAYFIRSYAREGRFGIDEQPKFWVRRAVDLTDGSYKIIKMVFRERFEAALGDLVYECVRSPRKEARILRMVAGHPYFMQGVAVGDAAGNLVRVLDYINGPTLLSHVLTLGDDHADYYHRHLPGVLDDFLLLVEAIGYLHEQGETHGDIRRDHIIRESHGGRCIWIDFDYSCLHRENQFGYDLAGLGNILIYLVGRGDVTVQGLREEGSPALARLLREDMNIVFRNRVANLRKVYPYVSESLSYVLSHFSLGASIFYDGTERFLDDLREARSGLAPARRWEEPWS
jgi:serine/threonine protein kinase